MKENEIQIGDWVRYRYNDRNGEEIVKDFQVDHLDRLGRAIYVWGKDLGNVGRVNKIEPIPLAAEILKKNGFVCKDIPFSPEWELFGLTLRRWDDRFHLKCEKDIDMEIIYVHQLQHLLKMVGIHRDIVL